MGDPRPDLVANWSYPTAIRFGPGRIAELPAACAAAGITKPLLVTDAGLATLDITKKTLAILEDAGLSPGLYADVQPNPVEQNVIDGVAALRAGGYDGVVAFGGGSGLDTGKLIAFMAGQRRPIWDFEDIGDWWTRADPAGILPVVAVPTTAGTGSEVGRAGVTTDVATHTKKVIFHPGMMPKVVICDPELTIGMPPAITAGTGMDALAHCLEAYCSPGYHPMADGIAVEGMRLVFENLPKAYADGGDIEARAHMMSAAAMGAAAFQKGLGAIHSLSHPVGALYNTHHGMTNAVFMPYVLAFNRPAIEARIDRLAAYLGIAGGFDGFLTAIVELRTRIGVPATLAAFGIDGSQAATIAEMAIVDPTAGGNPVPLTREAAEHIFRTALEGKLGDSG
ncbi:MAG: iron-containing alcohol dehydrogenase [Bauldia sp.]|uniref:iron-containing alcohol dehydrogenase n=1 Tax=Bauldia sp. TaxID=2575872 RepID=UPI001DE4C1BE|nr:iron-containing alcohol dehydrogenase [Bauldia sp.]MCB1496951.1 iron-containing alcohol dehydrogenase [Bauldia sp.]